jgi:uncharacterized membrane protein
MDINAHGQIVGSWKGRAALWENKKLILLPGLPGNGSASANTINERGQIVGYAWTGKGRTHAVLWTLRRG